MKTTSMTGFGRATLVGTHKTYRLEIKTLNSKSLDVQWRWGDLWTPLEAETLKVLQKELIRGKVTLSLYAEETSPKGSVPSTGLQFQVLDEVWDDWQRWLATKNQDTTTKADLAQAWIHLAARHPLLYKNAYQNNTELPASGAEPDAATVAAFRDALQEALNLCKEFRSQEGQGIASVVLEYLEEVQGILDHIRNNESKKPQIIRQKIESFLNEWKNNPGLGGSFAPDPGRMEQEILFYLEKKDISEEIVRLQAHLHLAKQILQNDTEQGRKLGFVAQEIGREINTIGSKASDFEIQHRVVMAKEWVEKIKEQSANLL
ncbi:MAG: hypothetical protein RLZZ121_1496 [Bacteroidota bacterium]|jgi:uncharacterized protein YicC (UPF0701 family)